MRAFFPILKNPTKKRRSLRSSCDNFLIIEDKIYKSATLQRSFGPVVFKGSQFILRAEHLEGTGQVFFDPHHRPAVVEFSAIIGSRKDSN